ncbi:MAG TPA: hypothetical protein VGJ30_02705, partial [Candidatus Angelobacter sp.]
MEKQVWIDTLEPKARYKTVYYKGLFPHLQWFLSLRSRFFFVFSPHPRADRALAHSILHLRSFRCLTQHCLPLITLPPSLRKLSCMMVCRELTQLSQEARMQFVARVVATVILGSLLFAQAFAEDSANSSSSTTTEPSAPNATGSSTAYLAPFIPMQTDTAAAQTKTKKDKAAGNGDSYPAVDLFVGYSFVRFSTNTAGVKETFNWHGFTGALAGNVNRWFSLVGDFGAYRIKDLPRPVSGSAYTYLFGPQFSHRGEHWTPFAHALFGASRLANIQVSTIPSGSAFFNRSFSQNSFATA